MKPCILSALPALPSWPGCAATRPLRGRELSGRSPRPPWPRYTRPAPSWWPTSRPSRRRQPDRGACSCINRTEEGPPPPLLSSPAPPPRPDRGAEAANAKLSDPRLCTEARGLRCHRQGRRFPVAGLLVHMASEAGGQRGGPWRCLPFAASTDPRVLESWSGWSWAWTSPESPREGATCSRHLRPCRRESAGPPGRPEHPRLPAALQPSPLRSEPGTGAFQTQAEEPGRPTCSARWNHSWPIDQPREGPSATPSSAQHGARQRPHRPALRRGVAGSHLARPSPRPWPGRGKAYFTREVFDLFAPIYGDSWTSLQGNRGPTYEDPTRAGLAFPAPGRRVAHPGGPHPRHRAGEHRGLRPPPPIARRSDGTTPRCAGSACSWARRPAPSSGRRAGILAGPGPGGAAGAQRHRGRRSAGLPPRASSPFGPGKPPSPYPQAANLSPSSSPGAPSPRACWRGRAHRPPPSYDATAWSLP